MIIKNNFDLIYKTKSDKVSNIVNLSDTTIDTFKIDNEDLEYIKNLCNMYSRTRGHFTSNILSKYINKCIVVKMPTYPLSSFITRSYTPVINLSVLPITTISDYSPSDIYALFVNAISLKLFIQYKPVSNDSSVNISNLIFSIFMKLFGKKGGLIGSYKNLIPHLLFLIHMYVNVSMFGVKQTPEYANKLSSQLYVDLTNIDINYDFNSINELINSLNKNRILSISNYKFSTAIIQIGGLSSLPMFEDVSRFYSILISSSVPGNTVFSSYWSKVNKTLYDKLLTESELYMSRIAKS